MEEFDFDIVDAALRLLDDAGRLAALYFSSQAAEVKGSQNLAGIADPVIDALIDKIIAAPDAAGTGHRLPGAGPRAPRRPLLGPALVQGVALDRLLGYVRPARRTSRAMPAACRKPGGTIAEQAAKTQSG